MFSNINNNSTLSSEHDWEDLCIQLRNQRTCTSDNYKWTRGGSIFNPVFGRCFSADLQMQHEFRCVNLIGRSWRTWKTNQITPTYLTWILHSSDSPKCYSVWCQELQGGCRGVQQYPLWLAIGCFHQWLEQSLLCIRTYGGQSLVLAPICSKYSQTHSIFNFCQTL